MRLMDKDELKHARFHMDKYYTKVVPYSIESEESKASAYMLGWNDALDAVIESAPTIDAVPVMHGKWIDTELTINYLFYCTCSVCGERQIIEVANYCPMCGAKMDSKGDAE